MKQRTLRRLGGVVIGLCSTGLVGCMGGGSAWGLQYALGAAQGELRFLSRGVPIEQALEDPDLTDEQRDKLALVVKARDYAEHVIGLNVGESYRKFVNLNGEPLAWNLSGSPKDAVRAYVWDIPFVGPISYLGYFNKDEALAERDRLVEAGYDTMLYEVDAFSTLGLLPDPVSSSLLDRSYTSLADTVVHELLHNTIWSGKDAVFSESLATFVGRTGSLEFLEHEYGSDSPLLEEARTGNADGDAINAFLKSILTEVNALYAQDITSDEKIAKREEIFEAARQRFTAEVQPGLNNPDRYGGYSKLAYNNAFLLVNVRYHSDMQVFADVYERVGRDWAQALEVFDAAAGSSNPFQYLRDYLNTPQN